MSAADADDALNGKVLYFLSHDAHGAFTVDENTGIITTSAALDREKWPSYNFQVFAVDLSPAAPRNSSAQVKEGRKLFLFIHILHVYRTAHMFHTLQVTVAVLDVNDNAPVFTQDPLVIEVSSRHSQRVLATMKAEDKDFGANGSVFYRFATAVKGFSINSLTGEIQATEPLQELTQAQRTLIVEAMDQGSPAQSAQGVVVIYVKEVEYNGIRFSRNARDVSIQENAAKGLSSKNNTSLTSSPWLLLTCASQTQVQPWLRLKLSTQMGPAGASATASSVGTERRPSSSTPPQVT